MSRKLRYCSFCGKESEDVLLMVAGPDVNICDECTKLAWKIVDPVMRGIAEYDSWSQRSTEG